MALSVTHLHTLLFTADPRQLRPTSVTTQMMLPHALPYWKRLLVLADYGGIRRSPSSSFADGVPLLSPEEDARQYTRQRKRLLRQWDKALTPEEGYYEVDVDYYGRCRPRPLELQHRPSCNTFHEYTSYQHYLGGGNYRHAWKGDESIVWKTSRRIFAMDEYGDIKTDANVMEFFTSDPYIANVHGHCGTSLVTPLLQDTVAVTLSGGNRREGNYHKSMDPTVSQNALSDDTKLRMAMELTSSLVSLHENHLIHADLHSPQWLQTENGTLQLHDFNMGYIQRYNTETNRFCAVELCTIGTFLSPESNRCMKNGTSATDVYSLASTFYWLMAGLKPFRGPDFPGKDETIHQVAHHSLKAVVDPHILQASPVHRLLDDLRQRMQVDDPRKRLPARQVLQELREYQSRNRTRIAKTGP